MVMRVTQLHCTQDPMAVAAVGAQVFGMSKAAVVIVFLRDSLNEWAHEHALDRYAKLAALRWSARRKSHL